MAFYRKEKKDVPSKDEILMKNIEAAYKGAKDAKDKTAQLMIAEALAYKGQSSALSEVIIDQQMTYMRKDNENAPDKQYLAYETVTEYLEDRAGDTPYEKIAAGITASGPSWSRTSS